ncbi:hypothetical protein JCM11251_004573 [Rhodosporidiobolus azoricus]
MGNDPPSPTPSPAHPARRSTQPPHSSSPDAKPSPPHELPALTFSPPLTTPEVPDTQPAIPTLPPAVLKPAEPPAAVPEVNETVASFPVQSPRLAQLRKLEAASISHSITPPTPIDPPPSTFSSTNGTTNTNNSTPPSRPSTPPSSQTASRTPSREPSIISPPPGLYPPPSPNLTVSRPSTPGHKGRGSGHHRRSSSTGSRSFRETLNAYAVEGENGQRSVNQYVLGETLGRGSYATVEKAVDRETGQEYAIKEFSKRRLRQIASAEAQRRERLSIRRRGRGRGRGRGGMRGGGTTGKNLGDERDPDSGPDNLDLVRTEVAIMKKVDHPNLASVHEVIDVTSDDALLIMELCEGGPILKLKDGDEVKPYTEEEARNIFRQLVLGIAYLHHNQIIHRDIKPDNALFADSSKTRVKLVDFGVSKFAASQHAEGLDAEPVAMSVAGSPAYMAPELLPGNQTAAGSGSAEDEERLGFSCDVWSLGVTLYTLVVGKLPFAASDPTELFRAIRETDPPYPPSLSPDLVSLLSRLLSKTPFDRPTVPQLWTDPWLTQSGGDPLPSYDDNVFTEITAPSKDEVDRALAVYRGSAFLALSAAAKFKGLLSKRKATNEAGLTSGSGSSSPLLSPESGPVVVDSPDLVASPGLMASPAPGSSSARVVSSPSIVASPPSSTLFTEEPSSDIPRGRPGFPVPEGKRFTPRGVQVRERRATRMDTMSSLSLGDAGSRWQSRDDEDLVRDQFGDVRLDGVGGEGRGEGEDAVEQVESPLCQSPSTSLTPEEMDRWERAVEGQREGAEVVEVKTTVWEDPE